MTTTKIIRRTSVVVVVFAVLSLFVEGEFARGAATGVAIGLACMVGTAIGERSTLRAIRSGRLTIEAIQQNGDKPL